MQELTSDGSPDSEAVTEALRRVEEARSVYRESRNLLAAFVMAASPETAAYPSSAVSMADRSTDNAEEDWRPAEQLILKRP